MFEIGGTELLLIAVVALVVIGPKELPNALRSVGRMTGKARAMTRHLRSGFDEMMRQAELEEMEKQWAEHNRRIMADTPAPAPASAASGFDPPPAGPHAADSAGADAEPRDPLAPHPQARHSQIPDLQAPDPQLPDPPAAARPLA